MTVFLWIRHIITIWNVRFFNLTDSSLADEHTLIITEADLHTDFSYVTDLGYELARSKEYKTNKHVFLYKRK